MKNKKLAVVVAAALGFGVLAGSLPGAQNDWLGTPVAFAMKDVTEASRIALGWEKATGADIEVMGIGMAPVKIKNPAAARVLARRAAIVDAQRYLAEAIGEIQVNAETTVENMIVKSDTINTRVKALVKGAKITGEGMNSDGSYYVTLALPLYGEGSVAAATLPSLAPAVKAPFNHPDELLPIIGFEFVDEKPTEDVPTVLPEFPEPPTPGYTPVETFPAVAETELAAEPQAAVEPEPEPVAEPVIEPQAAAEPEAAEPQAAEANDTDSSAGLGLPSISDGTSLLQRAAQKARQLAEAGEKTFDSYLLDPNADCTGIIIDASGMNLEPTFSPTVIDAEGSAIYGISNIDSSYAVNSGMVQYSKDLAASIENSRAGANPFVARAVATDGAASAAHKVNVVVSKADGDRILALQQQCGMLDKCAVVFIR